MPVFVTDVQPGFVGTKLAKADKLFWVTPVEKTAKQYLNAIRKRKWRVYISRRWKLIAVLLKFLPSSIYHRLG